MKQKKIEMGTNTEKETVSETEIISDEENVITREINHSL